MEDGKSCKLLTLDEIENVAGGAGKLEELVTRIKADEHAQELRELLQTQGKKRRSYEIPVKYYPQLCGFPGAAVTPCDSIREYSYYRLWTNPPKPFLLHQFTWPDGRIYRKEHLHVQLIPKFLIIPTIILFTEICIYNPVACNIAILNRMDLKLIKFQIATRSRTFPWLSDLQNLPQEEVCQSNSPERYHIRYFSEC